MTPTCRDPLLRAYYDLIAYGQHTSFCEIHETIGKGVNKRRRPFSRCTCGFMLAICNLEVALFGRAQTKGYAQVP